MGIADAKAVDKFGKGGGLVNGRLIREIPRYNGALMSHSWVYTGYCSLRAAPHGRRRPGFLIASVEATSLMIASIE